jgi:hypothetical protein
MEKLFSNVRISRRVNRLVARIIEKESVVIHQLSDKEAEQRSYYRLLHNRRLETGQILSYLQWDCQRQVVAGAHYLVFQDTTQPNFEHNRGNISDFEQLGVLADKRSLGFFLHPSLVVQADNGRCIGYSHVHTWSRQAEAEDKNQRQYKKQPIEEKESFRWLKAAQVSKQVLQEAASLTVVCDREADIGELFLQVPDERTHLLVRSNADRLLAQGDGKLSTLLDGLPQMAHYSFELRGDVRTGRESRQAQMSLTWSKVELQVRDKTKVLYVVEAREEAAPAGQKPLYWRLLTTHVIENEQQARQLLDWYAMRWNIEQLFRLLKHKGLNIEVLDLETGKALVQLTLLALLAVSKILLLHLASKQAEPVPIAATFTSEELACMQAVNQRYEGNTVKQKNPYPKDSLQWCYWILARVGGWKPHEKKAGVISLYRGWMHFQKILDGWLLAKYSVS